MSRSRRILQANKNLAGAPPLSVWVGCGKDRHDAAQQPGLKVSNTRRLKTGGEFPFGDDSPDSEDDIEEDSNLDSNSDSDSDSEEEEEPAEEDEQPADDALNQSTVKNRFFGPIHVHVHILLISWRESTLYQRRSAHT